MKFDLLYVLSSVYGICCTVYGIRRYKGAMCKWQKTRLSGLKTCCCARIKNNKKNRELNLYRKIYARTMSKWRKILTTHTTSLFRTELGARHNSRHNSCHNLRQVSPFTLPLRFVSKLKIPFWLFLLRKNSFLKIECQRSLTDFYHLFA